MTDNAVCLVTGATSGIGRATAQALAGMGRSVVILKQSAPSRIVNLTSTAFRRRRIDFADLQAQQRFEGMQAYCNSKLAVVLFTYELARRPAGTGVTANCVHPGVVRTNIGHGERVSLVSCA